MSLTHEQKSCAETEMQSPSLLRLFRFPLIVLILFGAIFAIPRVCVAYDYHAEEMFPVLMFTELAVPISVLLIAVWWLFFCGFGWLTRLAGVLLAAAVVVGIYKSVRELEFTTNPLGMVPRLHFIWETTAQERALEREKQEAAKPDALPTIDLTVGPEDFASYRGANRDGIVAFAKLDTDWAKSPPKQLWQRPCVGGYSGVAVAGNIAVTNEQRDAGEVVVCYDRATGRQRWVFPLGTQYKDQNLMGNGPRSTPTIHNNLIFSIGATGQMVCLDAQGKQKWLAHVLDDAHAKNVKWGLSGSPLIVGDLVIAHAGIDPEAPANKALCAYEQATGKIRWQVGNRKAGYSSPQLANLGNTPQILLFDGEGLVSYDKAGKELWNFPWLTAWDMNTIQPVVLGNDRVFISSEKDNGCAMLRIKAPDNNATAWGVEKIWGHDKLAARFANPVTDDKNIYALHNLLGVLTCLDVDTGKVKWKGERMGPGQMLLCDKVLLVVNGDSGEVVLFDADGKELARHAAFEKKDKTWNTPALAGDHLFVRNQAEIVCLKLPRK
jgi:outer membrane protein assembly factor BamB